MVQHVLCLISLLDLQRFIVELENKINDYLETVRFVYIPQAIPLEEFGENKKQLYQYALNFFHTKHPIRQQSNEEGNSTFKEITLH